MFQYPSLEISAFKLYCKFYCDKHVVVELDIE